MVLTTDALVEGTHFRMGWEPPPALGRRALRINVSDVAAMGAVPRAALVAIEAPADLPVRVLDGIMRGLVADARRLAVAVVGGNVAAGPHLALTVTLIGETGPRLLRRRGARAGDLLFVTGTLGGAAAAVRALEAGRHVSRPPVPLRVETSRRLARLATAAIDVSDGLLQDLGHLCRASGVTAEIEAARVPVAPRCRRELGAEAIRFALTAGEDYELLLAIPPRAAGRIGTVGCRLTRIGALRAGPPAVRLIDGARSLRVAGWPGFDHFAGGPRDRGGPAACRPRGSRLRMVAG